MAAIFTDADSPEILLKSITIVALYFFYNILGWLNKLQASRGRLHVMKHVRAKKRL